jgi:hypothetical protein
MQSQVYTIPSATKPGTYYTVTLFADGDTRCDCPDATDRRRQCKHQRQVLAGAIPAAATPAPAPTASVSADRYDAAYRAIEAWTGVPMAGRGA